MNHIETMSNEKLLEEIKRQWTEKATWDEINEYQDNWTLADDYISSDIEEHIYRLEQAYKDRGLELPERYKYVYGDDDNE